MDPPPENPYAPPQAQLLRPAEPRGLRELTANELNNLLATCFFLAIATLCLAFRFGWDLYVFVKQDVLPRGLQRFPAGMRLGLFAGQCMVFLLAALGCGFRQPWGRVFGVPAALLLIPGTGSNGVIVIVGITLYTLIYGARLFGANRFTFTQLQREERRRLFPKD